MIMEKDHRNLDEFHYFWSHRIYSCLLKLRNSGKLLKIKEVKERYTSKGSMAASLLKLFFY